MRTATAATTTTSEGIFDIQSSNPQIRPKNQLCIRRSLAHCVVFLAFAGISLPAIAEDTDLDTVGRLGVEMGFASLETLDQATNAKLVSQPALILHPELELSIMPMWLLTLESELKVVKYQAPNAAALFQDPSVLTSVTGGFHLRTRVFELGVLAGLGQSAFVAIAPSTTYIAVQNIFMPHVGGRLAYNGRFGKTTYLRLEALYLSDFPTTNDRGALQVSQSTRMLFNTHFGFNSFSTWLRFTGGFGMQNAMTSIGNQRSMMIHFGISIGNVWGQRVPLVGQ